MLKHCKSAIGAKNEGEDVSRKQAALRIRTTSNKQGVENKNAGNKLGNETNTRRANETRHLCFESPEADSLLV